MKTNLKEAITHMVNEEIVKAKDLIEKSLYSKLGIALEEKLMEYAPSVFNEEKDEDEEEDKETDSEDSEDEGDEEDGEDDESDEESDESEEDEDEDEQMNEELESYLYEELSNLILEIEKENNRKLTNEEIEYIASEFINEYDILSEELDAVGQEDEDIDNDGDKDKTDSYLHNRRKKIGKAMKKKKKG